MWQVIVKDNKIVEKCIPRIDHKFTQNINIKVPIKSSKVPTLKFKIRCYMRMPMLAADR